MYDIIFISYNENNADNNWDILKTRAPWAKRVKGVKGIHQAHIEAAKRSFTSMTWIVDADAIILDKFDFDYIVPDHQLDHVHVWSSINPINDLVYGYGGVKLLPTKLTINMDITKVDMTTSISNKFIAMPEISNITAFNTDEFSAWRSAFRECCKLASKTINRQESDETDVRLATWCSDTGKARQFGEVTIRGAKAGRDYGVLNQGNLEALNNINNYKWLKEKYNE